MARLNRMLLGWANYFCLGPVSRAYRAIDRHVRQSAPSVACAGSTRCRVGGRHGSPTEYLHDELGLVRLSARTAELPVGESVSPCPRAGCGKTARPVR